MVACRSNKFEQRFFGPFLVVEHIGQVAYWVQLLANSRIHDMFHYSMLKKYMASEDIVTPVFLDDLLVTSEDRQIFEEEIEMNPNLLKNKRPRSGSYSIMVVVTLCDYLKKKLMLRKGYNIFPKHSVLSEIAKRESPPDTILCWYYYYIPYKMFSQKIIIQL